MKTILSFILVCLASLVSSAQTYSMVGGVETLYKGQYTITVKLDEKTKILSFETNAPVSVVTLETYTPEEIISRKGVEYTNTHSKVGNKYSYDLKKSLLKDKQAYWLKIAVGKNGSPFAEYYFKKTTTTAATAPAEEDAVANDEESKNAEGATVIKTNIKCAAGKTKIINALKGLEGVEEVKIDLATGKLTITYSSDGTPYTAILSTINENGFDANGQPSSAPASNPCIKKAAN